MHRYLLYDGGCSACSQIAQEIQSVVGSTLRTLNLRGREARELLDRAYPAGWVIAPYVVAVDGQRVRAWTGVRAGLELARLLGPRRSWRVWRLARRTGIDVPMVPHPRRQFLKLGAAVTAAAGSVLVFGQASPSEAYACGSCTQYQCQYVGYSCLNTCYPNQYCAYYLNYQCYDPCGDSCGGYSTFQDCNGCCG